jgi:hypothetical protein
MNQLIIPPELTRSELEKRFKEFMEEDELVSREFWNHFGPGKRMAQLRMPIPSLYDCVDAAVSYDGSNNFDLRMLITLVFPEDRKLFVDLASFVAERYTNNPTKPAGQLTLKQFKADLARRMGQAGF